MKTRIQNIMLVLIFCVAVEGMTTPFSERKMENLINALTNETLVVGAFRTRTAGDDHKTWFTLHNGENIWKNYYQLKDITMYWEVMRTTVPIRGSFDDLIFFTEDRGGFGAKFYGFVACSDSKWVVILKKQFNEAGKLTPSEGIPFRGLETYSQELLDENPFFNAENLFKVYDHSDGSFCIGWSEKCAPRIGEELYSTNLVTLLQEIVSAPNFPPDPATLRQQVEAALFESFLGTYSPPPSLPPEE